uniref:Small ribosomal subunit protein mS39 n=1 Tax=Callorhinchus milii TaxID=7868 RepID=A0A4W3I8A9_CALMI|eukprot:gi/632960409/ref/XP_007896180.1/ PREDICTED: pentatricopeptide repeat domain-containing protein 3, mitochondrial isoform X1 [Callorhinchus milii]
MAAVPCARAWRQFARCNGCGGLRRVGLAPRSYSSSRLLCQQIAPSQTGSAEEIVIPRKKTWDKLAVLQALASTVNRDPTAAHYRFQDDSYLIPKTSPEFRLYSLSQESGRTAAKYIFSNYPNFFQRDFAEPSIPCLMPQQLEPLIEEISEAALKERIQLRKVKDSVSLYDQLVQAGTPLSLGTTNGLLDLLCVYGDQEPPSDDQIELGEGESLPAAMNTQKRRGRLRKASELLTITWRDNNNAERIFNLMPERNEHSFCTLIRGMVKFGAYTKAINMYTDLLNNRMKADVHTFNALIAAAPELKEKYNEKLDFIVDLLKQMAEQEVRPNLLTFNSVLKSFRRCGAYAKGPSLQVVNEMKALGIEPCLATFDHLLAIFSKSVIAGRSQADIIFKIFDEMEQKYFVPQDPDDVYFFTNAIKVCLNLKDLELSYRVQKIVETGDNRKLLGDPYQQSIYYGRLFTMVCMMENIDMVLKWYKELIPSLYYPNTQGMKELLQALDTENRLELIPRIWKDIKQLGHSNKQDLVEEVLELMAREKHSPQLQVEFADCALDVKTVYNNLNHNSKLEWTSGSLGNITTLLLRGGRTDDAWAMLQLFKANNRIPGEYLLDEFLDSAKESKNNALAMDVVKLATAFSLPAAPKLATRVTTEFQLTNEDRIDLDELNATSSDSSDSSDSDKE